MLVHFRLYFLLIENHEPHHDHPCWLLQAALRCTGRNPSRKTPFKSRSMSTLSLKPLRNGTKMSTLCWKPPLPGSTARQGGRTSWHVRGGTAKKKLKWMPAQKRRFLIAKPSSLSTEICWEGHLAFGRRAASLVPARMSPCHADPCLETP